MNSHGARGPRGHYLTVERPAQSPCDAFPGGDRGPAVSARVGEPSAVAGATAPARNLDLSSDRQGARRPDTCATAPLSGNPHPAAAGSTELSTSAAVEVAALLNDLAPACTGLIVDRRTQRERPCPVAAEWVVWLSCPCGKTDALPHCTGHLEKTMRCQMYLAADHRQHGHSVATRTERIRSKPH